MIPVVLPDTLSHLTDHVAVLLVLELLLEGVTDIDAGGPGKDLARVPHSK